MDRYRISGMSCAACSARVEKAVSAVKGVTSCSVNLLTNSMTVEGSASPESIISAVTDAGYGAEQEGAAAKSSSSSLEDTETPKLKKRLLASLVFLAGLMYISMGHMMLGFPLPKFFEGNHIAMGLAELLLSAVIMVINQRFFINGFKGLIHRSPNMDTLVALGSGASFVYSTYSLFCMTYAQVHSNLPDVQYYMNEFYFESAGMILTLITVGKMLEARSKGKTTDAVKGLMNLSPKTATVMRGDDEVTISVDEVRVGDIFSVKPGESIPVDGTIIYGSSSLDESALTGESIPVDKSEGDSVSAGTINQQGFLKCRADKVGANTTLAQIIQTVSDTAAGKAPIAKTADKVSGIFVPTVMGIATVTAIVWLICGFDFGYALARGISVLVISCPCALGLATPVAVMVGNGLGAKNGILFKNASALEYTGKTQIAVLDKTGTITNGEPVVTDIINSDGVSKTELLKIAYSLEKLSEHPLAKAVIKKAEAENLTAVSVSDFTAVSGSGLSGKLDGRTIFGGNLNYIGKNISIPKKYRSEYDRLASLGKTPLLFASTDSFLGIIAVADVIKDDSVTAIDELRNMGIRTVMLTGDNEITAAAIGKEAGVDEVISGVLPNGKAAEVKRLQGLGKVLMVGDGINDAPALTAADIGIAVGKGTDIAIDAADIVLMKNKLRDVPASIRLSRGTLKIIHQNLFWAFFYNIIGIPVAAGVFIPLFGLQLSPMLGAAAMSLSSFCVVTNALRLNTLKIYDGKNDRRINQNPAEQNQSSDKQTMVIAVSGMMCSHCEATVKQALEALPQIEEATADHNKGTVTLVLNNSVDDKTIKKVIKEKGYKYSGHVI